MDPDANIAARRDLIARLRADPGDQDALSELADLSQALFGWVKGGGFLPAAPDWIKVAAAGFALLHS